LPCEITASDAEEKVTPHKGRGSFSLEIIIVRLCFLWVLKGYTEECYSFATEMLNLINICLRIFFLHLNCGFCSVKTGKMR
jgi:hypothetical protein